MAATTDETLSIEGRIALVIGNGAYVNAMPLRNPRNDAEAIALRLAKLGFHVISGIDLDRDAMEDKFVEFEAAMAGATAAVLFYAGHGLQVKDRNYLIPVDADIRQEIQLKRRAFLLDELLGIMVRRARASLIFLDACRDNPFARSLLRGMREAEQRHYLIRSGLAEVKASQGSFIAFATAPDNVAHDGRGANSPFTEGILAHIDTPDTSISDMMIEVRKDVLNATDGTQEPWDQSSLRERFCFKPSRNQPVSVRHDWSDIGGVSTIDRRTVEHTYWVNIQHSNDPCDFEGFLLQFPDGDYAALGRKRAEDCINGCRNNAILERLLNEYPKSSRNTRAREKLEELSWGCVRAGPAADIKTFLARWPDSRFAPKAMVSLMALQREAIVKPRRIGIQRRMLLLAVVIPIVIVSLAWGALWRETNIADMPVFTTSQPKTTINKSLLPKPGAANKPTETTTHIGLVSAKVGSGGVSDDVQWFKPGASKGFRDCLNCPEMVIVPAGNFLMGSPDDELNREADEYQHEVTIAQPLAVGRYEVSVGEYQRCVSEKRCSAPIWQEVGSDFNIEIGANDRYKKLGVAVTGENYPIVGVSWHDAKVYTEWLSQKTRKNYRLLTEAEWEYAARANTTGSYSFLGNIASVKANYNSNFSYGGSQIDETRAKPLPVNSLRPNPWGLYHVHGNVWEWVEDCYIENYSATPRDGSPAKESPNCRRVLRGGSWDNDPRLLRVADRARNLAMTRGTLVGFRLARTLNP